MDSGAFFLSRQGKSTEVKSAKSRFKKGDILYGKLRPYLDKAVIAPTDGICSTDILVFRPAQDICVAYLLGLIHSPEFLNHAIQTTNGVNHPRTSWTGLSTFSWNVPREVEQEKIAAVLWKIQRAIDIEEKLIATARELKHSTMHQLFGRGLHGEKLKETEIGMIPDSWEVVPLGRHLLLAQYGLSIRGQQVGRYPILRMNCQLDGKTIFRDLQFVELDQKTFAAFQVKDGDLLFNRTNSFELVGRTSIFRSNREAVFASYLIRLTLDQSEYYPEFVNFYFNQPSVQADLKRLASRGVSQSNISASKLKEYYIPKTSLDEQREISGILQSIDSKIEILERKRATLQDLFKTMLHKLMTGEIRVVDLDIDVSEITDGADHETIRI
ncbi:MAG TPA: restriction endonuclease subunit S [Candidatus Acidoferrales bacterium]|nr:restriction endonuclease subunit S [Candidatus Acidoferrales bacterium]